MEELTHELLALIEPAARELGTGEALRVLDPSSCEGDRQLEVGRERRPRGRRGLTPPSGRY